MSNEDEGCILIDASLFQFDDYDADAECESDEVVIFDEALLEQREGQPSRKEFLQKLCDRHNVSPHARASPPTSNIVSISLSDSVEDDSSSIVVSYQKPKNKKKTIDNRLAKKAMSLQFGRAIKRGDAMLMRRLLHYELDYDECDDKGYTAFLRAAKMNNRIMVEYLSDQYADIQAVTYTGESAVHLSVMKGSTDTLEYVLQLGLDIDEQLYDGDTAMHLAILDPNPEVVQILLDYDPDMTIENHYGYTPEDYLNTTQGPDRDYVSMLIESWKLSKMSEKDRLLALL